MQDEKGSRCLSELPWEAHSRAGSKKDRADGHLQSLTYGGPKARCLIISR